MPQSALSANNKMNMIAKEINEALAAVLEADERVYILGEDILDPYGGAFKITKGLSSRWPDRVITTPISESAFTGIAAGMALRGDRPVVEIMFGDFITLAFDQILNHITKYNFMYNNLTSCPVVIRTPMGGGRGYGPTHSQSLEKYFVGIPGLNVAGLNRFHNVKSFYAKLISKEKNPSLIIENKKMYGLEAIGEVESYSIFDVEYHDGLVPSAFFSPKGFKKTDVCLIAYSGGCDLALEAAERLAIENEIFSSVLMLGPLSPLPLDVLKKAALESDHIVIIEEGSPVMGIGSEIASQMVEKNFNRLKNPVHRISSKEGAIPCAPEKELDFLPNVDSVIKKVRSILG